MTGFFISNLGVLRAIHSKFCDKNQVIQALRELPLVASSLQYYYGFHRKSFPFLSLTQNINSKSFKFQIPNSKERRKREKSVFIRVFAIANQFHPRINFFQQPQT